MTTVDVMKDMMGKVHSLFLAENDCAAVADTKLREHSIHKFFDQREQEVKTHIHALTSDIKQQQTSPEMEELNTLREKVCSRDASHCEEARSQFACS
jgi:hypothetical protein